MRRSRTFASLGTLTLAACLLLPFSAHAQCGTLGPAALTDTYQLVVPNFTLGNAATWSHLELTIHNPGPTTAKYDFELDRLALGGGQALCGGAKVCGITHLHAPLGEVCEDAACVEQPVFSDEANVIRILLEPDWAYRVSIAYDRVTLDNPFALVTATLTSSESGEREVVHLQRTRCN